MAGATFHGMSPWESDAGIVECEGTELGLVDLHNECDFLEVRVTPGSGADLLVRLMFRHQPTAGNFGLSFTAVSDFRAEQLDYHRNDALLFHDASHVPNSSGSSTFEIVVAALQMNFQASKVEFLLM
jgi:hypothetical protein